MSVSPSSLPATSMIMTQTEIDILVVGGGLSGLAAAWQLDRAGTDVRVLEGRARFGGRVLTAGQDLGYDCDLGPSWFWQGQPLILSLLRHFAIPFYEQYADGHVLIQHATGQIQRVAGPSPMVGARRMVGGIGRLADAIAAQIPQERRLLSHTVRSLTLDRDRVAVAASSPDGPTTIRAGHVALALPPRLAAHLAWSPTLPQEARRQLAETPTWMAGHAKFFAVYPRPFWREAGLCGSAMSRRGPLAEIHDASPQSASAFSLFGFIGLDASTRARLGRTQLSQMAIQQLVTLFGQEAGEPLQTYLQDWSQEDLTAGPGDRQPQTRHPEYGLQPAWGNEWSGRVSLISSETSVANGGLIEGALEAGIRFAQRFVTPQLPADDDPSAPHAASMDWDWLSPDR